MKNWIKSIIIVLVFCISLVIFFVILNQGNADTTTELAGATLPIVSVDLGGEVINEMHGYKEEMEVASLRNQITPIGSDRNIKLVIDRFDNIIEGLNIELRSIDGERLIEEKEITGLLNEKNETIAEFSFKDLIEKDNEYSLRIMLILDNEKTVNYYTSIIYGDKLDALDKVNFVKDFSLKTMNKDTVKEITRYLEPEKNADNTDFGMVNIHSSVSNISWGDLNPEITSKKKAMIYDISESLGSIELSYQIKTSNNREEKYYDIVENYTIRKTPERYYLLSYNRQMNHIFNPEKTSITSNIIDLGIQGTETDLVQNETGEIITFTNLGRLYSVNLMDNKISRLFAFFQDEKDDERHFYKNNDIKVLKVEESGNIYFIVYGYMNRGIHEGMTGITLYLYDAQGNTIEEQLFVPYYKNSEILMKDINKFCYMNGQENLFMYMDGSIIKVSIQDKNIDIIEDNITNERFFTSNDSSTIAWQVKGENNVIKVMNLITENKQEINSEDYIKVLGFMAKDLIYGLCKKADAISDNSGGMTFPFYKLKIVDENNKLVKEYSSDAFIISGEVRENQIVLKRVNKIDDSLIQAEDEHITSNTERKKEYNTVRKTTNETYKKITEISLKKEIENNKLLTPKEVIYEGSRTISREKTEDNRYICFAGGHVRELNEIPSKAIQEAFNNRGFVIDMLGRAIYKRSEITGRNQIMAIEGEMTTDENTPISLLLDICLDLNGVSRNTKYALEQNNNAIEILENNLKEIKALDVTGISLEILNYYLDRDYPILVLNGENSFMLTGYNGKNYVVMNPKDGSLVKYPMEEVNKMTDNILCRLITYVKYNLDN